MFTAAMSETIRTKRSLFELRGPEPAFGAPVAPLVEPPVEPPVLLGTVAAGATVLGVVGVATAAIVAVANAVGVVVAETVAVTEPVGDGVGDVVAEPVGVGLPTVAVAVGVDVTVGDGVSVGVPLPPAYTPALGLLSAMIAPKMVPATGKAMRDPRL